MLRILDRYLLRELGLGILAVGAVLLLITVGGTFADVLGKVAGGRYPASVMFPVLGLRMVDTLTFVVPLAVFLGALQSLSRVWRDSEMHVLASSGFGPGGLLRPVGLLALPLALATALVSLWLGPWSVRTADALIEQANRSVIAAGLEPGRFVELPGKSGIIFVDSMSNDGTRLGKLFVESERADADGSQRVDIVTARRGELYYESQGGNRFLALFDGHRFEGRRGHDDWRLMRYARNDLALSQDQEDVDGDDPDHALPTPALWRQDEPGAHAELAWRIGAPFTGLVLLALALPLARQSPREPRYGRMLVAILCYFLYSNVLLLARAGIVKGRLDPAVGLWPVHLAVFAVAALMLWRQYAPRRVREIR
ncbi:MAG: LPS export ABC transporter permease LptF [Mizugakiibacter sp.]|uniref:LPS export ABC transporter permease LptF n=1 Tax=Mizugakiibacter sp. TaxID=1972610 RepID=UPI0031C731A8|nr:LPS export ABC transporter permease LptF [Xanthomonadaceae bacterium]